MAKITLRERLPSDVNFIYVTWLKGLYYGNDLFKEIPKDIFMAKYHDVIEKILGFPEVIVRVACLEDTEDVILGYAIFQGPKLHWIFVKESWRRMGIAKSLAKDVKTVTHLTRVGKFLKDKYQLEFNPFF